MCWPHLDVASPSIKVDVNVLNIPVLCKLVNDVVLLSFLVDPLHKHYPTLNSYGEREREREENKGSSLL